MEGLAELRTRDFPTARLPQGNRDRGAQPPIAQPVDVRCTTESTLTSNKEQKKKKEVNHTRHVGEDICSPAAFGLRCVRRNSTCVTPLCLCFPHHSQVRIPGSGKCRRPPRVSRHQPTASWPCYCRGLLVWLAKGRNNSPLLFGPAQLLVAPARKGVALTKWGVLAYDSFPRAPPPKRR